MAISSGKDPFWTAKRGIVQNGLVLNLDAAVTQSYPGTGTVWRDLSGRNNHGTFTNGPTYDRGNGGSISFDGVDDYITSPISNTWNANLYCSGTAWFYLRALTGTIFAINGANTWQVQISPYTPLNIYASPAGPAGQIPTGGIVINRNANVIAGTTIVAPLNKWTHIAYSWDGTLLIVYLNGSGNYYCSNNAGPNTGNITSASIGRNGFAANNYSNVTVANVQIYNRGISIAEMVQNFNVTRNRFGV